MGRAGGGGHSGGHSSGGHSSSRMSGGHSFGGGSSHRAGSGSSHSGPSFGGGYHSNSFGNYNHYGPTYVGRRFYGGGFSGITGIIVAIIFVIAIFSGLSTKGNIPASTQNREKVHTGVVFDNNCVVDEIGWIDNPRLKNDCKTFTIKQVFSRMSYFMNMMNL